MMSYLERETILGKVRSIIARRPSVEMIGSLSTFATADARIMLNCPDPKKVGRAYPIFLLLSRYDD
jgi:hypothetical protein